MARQTFTPASRQHGLALITAMLVVAIAATTAAYLSFDQQIWLRQAQNLTDRAQAEVVRAGAQEWAITILAKDAKDSKNDDLTEDWAKPLPPLAVEGGQVTGRIFDAQGKFNLNNLVRGGAPSPADIGAFKHLLESFSIDPNLSDAVIDWIDADSNASSAGAEDIDYLQMKIPYRAANQPLQSVEELRLVRGFTKELVDKLRPWISALPQPTETNLNTAPKEVLSAVFYTLPISAIESFMAQRPYKNQVQMGQELVKLAAGTTLPQAFYGIKSSYFEVEVTTLFGRYQRTTQALIQRSAGEAGFRALWHSQRLFAGFASSESGLDENPDTATGGNI
ncbi:MAG: type II secretion system minor pseudopilin GspK [Sulfuricaulis sp.]|uniref:type II secretion system minor pseudopilin GspK n=1 Tax=Sulfuricaulis sp. TaxID=2003553 RepID=UPI0025FFB17C|nr:type II secretion system minor pseudopilin GspK [Sulfuricaulis sp.]MCR4347278.1 type II secretion system minor pseudopilin GspK [Sulfuricaulis sp.]